MMGTLRGLFTTHDQAGAKVEAQTATTCALSHSTSIYLLSIDKQVSADGNILHAIVAHELPQLLRVSLSILEAVCVHIQQFASFCSCTSLKDPFCSGDMSSHRFRLYSEALSFPFIPVAKHGITDLLIASANVAVEVCAQ